MKTYEKNMADQALVVKSLKVLDKIEGATVREIQQSVEAVRKQQNYQTRLQNQYWEALSDDGLITPIEKQEMLREIKNIDRSYAAITTQAQALGVPTSLLSDYTATYNALHTYLYTTLKLFDDMTKETAIDSRETFNGYFSSYYYAENYVQLAITSDIMETLNIRVLQSLDEEGEEGELAIYHGGLYQYTSNHWQNITTGAYKGARNQLPPDEEGAFFIASEEFYKLEVLIVNGEELYVNGEQLGILGLCRKGYIYYCEEGIWYEESDRTNWRYAAAFADVISITGELPQIFQDAIDNLQGEIDDLDYEVGLKASQTSLENEIAARQGQYTIVANELLRIDGDIADIVDEYNQQQTQIDSKIDHLPVYYGITQPNNPKEGDFYLYTGSGDHKNQIRRYHNATWEWLEDPEHNNAYRNYYMMALEDILQAEQAGSGYFSALFASSFWANAAIVNTLETKTIYLQEGGSIQSQHLGYHPETQGLKIDEDGNIDANGNTHLGASSTNKVAIGVPLAGNSDFNNYDVVIGGRALIKSDTTIKGNLDGATGTFSGTLKAVSFELVGVNAGNVIQREFNNIFDEDRTRKTFNLCTLARGTMRIKITYNVTRVGDVGPYISIDSDRTSMSQTGSGTLVKDISFSEYQNIKVVISDAGDALDNGGTISVSNIQLCLSADDSIFKSFTQFFLIDTYVDRTR